MYAAVRLLRSFLQEAGIATHSLRIGACGKKQVDPERCAQVFLMRALPRNRQLNYVNSSKCERRRPEDLLLRSITRNQKRFEANVDAVHA